MVIFTNNFAFEQFLHARKSPLEQMLHNVPSKFGKNSQNIHEKKHSVEKMHRDASDVVLHVFEKHSQPPDQVFCRADIDIEGRYHFNANSYV